MRNIYTAIIACLIRLPCTFADDLDSTNAIIREFQRQATVIAVSQSNTSRVSFLTGKIDDTHNLSIKMTTFRDCHERVEGTLSKHERESLILKGQIPDLLRDGPCWRIVSFGSITSEICGYLTTDTRELIFLWIVPEG
jgi:hypothetical protein